MPSLILPLGLDIEVAKYNWAFQASWELYAGLSSFIPFYVDFLCVICKYLIVFYLNIAALPWLCSGELRQETFICS